MLRQCPGFHLVLLFGWRKANAPTFTPVSLDVWEKEDLDIQTTSTEAGKEIDAIAEATPVFFT